MYESFFESYELQNKFYFINTFFGYVLWAVDFVVMVAILIVLRKILVHLREAKNGVKSKDNNGDGDKNFPEQLANFNPVDLSRKPPTAQTNPGLSKAKPCYYDSTGDTKTPKE